MFAMTRDPAREADETLHGPLRSPEDSLPGSCAVAPVPCTGLADLGERTLSDLMTLQQRIDQAKRTLWALTAAPRPEPRRIEATMANIADLVREQQDYFTAAIAAWMAKQCEACRSGTHLAVNYKEHDDDDDK